MKKILRSFIYCTGTLLLLVLFFILFLEVRGIPTYPVEKIDFPQVQGTPERVAQGEKIASVLCVVCHSGSDGKLSGKLVSDMPTIFGDIHSANITQSKEHGIGNWTDAQIAYLLRTGCRTNGQYVPFYMPKFPAMSDEDMKSVIALLHSDKPCVQASEIPTIACQPSLLTKLLCLVQFKKIPYPSQPVAEPDTNNLVAYGKYLVTGRYVCYPCHSRDFKTVDMQFPEKSDGYLGGGNKLIQQTGHEILSANITRDKATGLGEWTEQDLSRALREQKNKAGKSLREPMIPYNGMTDIEVKGIWKYLQTIPVIKNEVDRRWDQD